MGYVKRVYNGPLGPYQISEKQEKMLKKPQEKSRSNILHLTNLSP